MENCTHCGSNEGYYTKNNYRGSGIVRFNFDNSPAENGDMYDGLTVTQSKYVYCLSCDKRLFETKNIQLDY